MGGNKPVPALLAPGGLCVPGSVPKEDGEWRRVGELGGKAVGK